MFSADRSEQWSRQMKGYLAFMKSIHEKYEDIYRI